MHLPKIFYRFFFFFLIFAVFPKIILAAPYGSGAYNCGVYGTGLCTTPAPPPPPGPPPPGPPGPPGGGGGSTSPSCSSPSPLLSPDLYQVDTTDKNARINFAPIIGPATSYQINYGYKLDEERFNTYVGSSGQPINLLPPNTVFYFKVRAFNDCAPGPWSNSIKVSTMPLKSKKIGVYYKTLFTFINGSLQVNNIFNRSKTAVSIPITKPPSQPSNTPSQPANNNPPPQNNAVNPAPAPAQPNLWENVVSFVKNIFKF